MESKTRVSTVQEKKGPEKKFRAGAVSATVWRNASTKTGEDSFSATYASVQLERAYKDKETWKTTGSLRINDLPKAALVLSKAYDYLVSKQQSDDSAIEDIM